MTEGEGHRNVIMTEVSNFWTQLLELGGGIRLWFHDLKHFTLVGGKTQKFVFTLFPFNF